MSNKEVEEALKEGMYGKKQIKPSERKRFLGTIRERVVIALTKGQLMQDKALRELESAMKQHPDTELLLNGHIASKFMKEEKALADKYNIPYTSVSNQDAESDLGAVLTYDYAVDIENIFVTEEFQEEANENNTSLLATIKSWFKPSS
ncbi:YueI family protein [Pontibacillus salicampi]|uniref:YueI family protein n=1 Tax=Pontibacillus salicampi TaxID=1449801 RepID=A0ABV6LM34_9BACI